MKQHCSRSGEIRIELACACGERRRSWHEDSAEGKEEAEAYLNDQREEGWIVGRRGDLCPYCKPETS